MPNRVALLLAVVIVQAIAITKCLSSLRDPFLAPEIAPCYFLSESLEQQIAQWQFIGLVESKHKRQAWIKNKQSQWLSLSIGDNFPQLPWITTEINMHFLEIVAPLSQHCPNTPSIRLYFNE